MDLRLREGWLLCAASAWVNERGVCDMSDDTDVRAVAEEVDAQLVAHAVVTLIVGELDKRDHLLERREGLHPLLVIAGLSDGLADPFQTR